MTGSPPTNQNQPLPGGEEYLTIRVNQNQLEQLVSLGFLTPAEIEAGRQAGGLEMRVPASLYREYEAAVARDNELEQLARQIEQSGLAGPARLFLNSGRPLSFFGSQILLLAQPVSRMAYGKGDPAGRFSRLLEDRANLDRLLQKLDRLEDERRTRKKSKNSGSAVISEDPRNEVRTRL